MKDKIQIINIKEYICGCSVIINNHDKNNEWSVISANILKICPYCKKQFIKKI